MSAARTPSSDATAAFVAERSDLVARPGSSGPGRRRALTALTDEWLSRLFELSGADPQSVALVAVGGYGRSELAPGSDIDVLLLHRNAHNIAQVADRIWYPIWDSGLRLDHSVRTVPEARRLAGQDLKVVLGILDSRTIAGDAELTESLRASVFADWRAMARQRLGDLRDTVEDRRGRFGELAHMLEPDLKEAYGGLRELTVLRAIAATWLTDIPHGQIDHAREFLLDVRDSLHISTGRANDVLHAQDRIPVAEDLGFADTDELLRALYAAARRIAFVSDTSWHRVLRLTKPSGKLGLRRLTRSGPARVPLTDGVVLQDGEVVLAMEAKPERDPVLVLRAAAAAAQAGYPLAPNAVERLASTSAPMPVPWPLEARDALVSLLGAGRPAVAVWESLDQAGIISRLIPGWDIVRCAPQHNPVHRFTVDRHLVETAVEASALTRTVSRPDLLLVGSLLHDIGKGQPGDHTVVGIGIAEKLAPHMGFDDADSAVLVSLVAHHLLLPDTATRRDLNDPMTVQTVVDAVGNTDSLQLLHALTIADAAATGPAAWSDWKKKLIDDLVLRTEAALGGRRMPSDPGLTDEQLQLAHGTGVEVLLDIGSPTCTVTVAAPDRLGMLGAVAGVLSLNRLQVRAASTLSVGDRAVQIWTVQPLYGDPPGIDKLRGDMRRALEGTLDVAAELAKREAAYDPQRPEKVAARVDIVEGASARASVLEVRTHDSPGLLHRIGKAISSSDGAIVGAKVATLGSEVVDVFYLVNRDGHPLSEDHCAAVVATVRGALAHP